VSYESVEGPAGIVRPHAAVASARRSSAGCIGSPEMVIEVSYAEWTPDGLLRHVVYLGEREDKPAIEVRRERPHSPLRPFICPMETSRPGVPSGIFARCGARTDPMEPHRVKRERLLEWRPPLCRQAVSIREDLVFGGIDRIDREGRAVFLGRKSRLRPQPRMSPRRQAM
jgi:hypothetical protein